MAMLKRQMPALMKAIASRQTNGYVTTIGAALKQAVEQHAYKWLTRHSIVLKLIKLIKIV